MTLEVRAAALVIDVNDLSRGVRFWGGLLDTGFAGRGDGWVDVARLGADGPMLSLQLVEEVKERKNRLHLDLEVPDFEAARQRALGLGAQPVSGVHDDHHRPWQVLADPEGNEFCLQAATA